MSNHNPKYWCRHHNRLLWYFVQCILPIPSFVFLSARQLRKWDLRKYITINFFSTSWKWNNYKYLIFKGFFWNCRLTVFKQEPWSFSNIIHRIVYFDGSFLFQFKSLFFRRQFYSNIHVCPLKSNYEFEPWNWISFVSEFFETKWDNAFTYDCIKHCQCKKSDIR